MNWHDRLLSQKGVRSWQARASKGELPGLVMRFSQVRTEGLVDARTRCAVGRKRRG